MKHVLGLVSDRIEKKMQGKTTKHTQCSHNKKNNWVFTLEKQVLAGTQSPPPKSTDFVSWGEKYEGENYGEQRSPQFSQVQHFLKQKCLLVQCDTAEQQEQKNNWN